MSGSEPPPPRTYREAGVDPERAERALERVRQRIRATFGPEVVTDLGLFAAAVRLPGPGTDLVLATIDGVGTKTAVAALCGRWEGIGADLVHHCANDLAVHNARPLLFLDYVAASRLEPAVFTTLLGSMAEACRALGVALVGGESAEMPGVYAPGQFDVVGCMAGLAHEQTLRTGAGMQPGDVLLGLAASGLHTNGFSLARAVLLREAGDGGRFEPSLGVTRCEALLVPHRCYAPSLLALYAELGDEARGAAHITGGGIAANLRRIVAPHCRAVLRRGSWPLPELIALIAREGAIAYDELERTFNMGLGVIVCVARSACERAEALLRAAGETVWRVGEITAGEGEVELVGAPPSLAPPAAPSIV